MESPSGTLLIPAWHAVMAQRPGLAHSELGPVSAGPRASFLVCLEAFGTQKAAAGLCPTYAISAT